MITVPSLPEEVHSFKCLIKGRNDHLDLSRNVLRTGATIDAGTDAPDTDHYRCGFFSFTHAQRHAPTGNGPQSVSAGS